MLCAVFLLVMALGQAHSEADIKSVKFMAISELVAAPDRGLPPGDTSIIPSQDAAGVSQPLAEGVSSIVLLGHGSAIPELYLQGNLIPDNLAHDNDPTGSESGEDGGSPDQLHVIITCGTYACPPFTPPSPPSPPFPPPYPPYPPSPPAPPYPPAAPPDPPTPPHLEYDPVAWPSSPPSVPAWPPSLPAAPAWPPSLPTSPMFPSNPPSTPMPPPPRPTGPYTLLTWVRMAPQFERSTPAIELRSGQNLTLRSMSLLLLNVSEPLGSVDHQTLTSLTPSALFRVPPGAGLALEDVSLMLRCDALASLLLGLCSSTASWPDNPGVTLWGGDARIAFLDSSAPGPDGRPGGGGWVRWRDVRFTCPAALRDIEGHSQPMGFYCGARSVATAAELNAALRPGPTGPALVALATNMSLPTDGSWQPQVGYSTSSQVVLLGHPNRTTFLDLAALGSVWSSKGPTAEDAAPVVTLQDLTLVNLPYASDPGSAEQLLSVALNGFEVPSTSRAVAGEGEAAAAAAASSSAAAAVYNPRLHLVRCTVVLPDPEVAFLQRVAARRNASNLVQYTYGISSGGDGRVATRSLSIRLQASSQAGAPSGVPLPPGGAGGRLTVDRLELRPRITLESSTLISASAYAASLPAPRAPPLLPQFVSRSWPPLVLLRGDQEAAMTWGPLAVRVAGGFEEALAAQSAGCGDPPGRARVTLLRGGATTSQAPPDDPSTISSSEPPIVVDRRSDDGAVGGANDGGSDSGGGGDVGNGDRCTVTGRSSELSPGGNRTFVDLRGRTARAEIRRPLTLRDLVIFNLAPGGWAWAQQPAAGDSTPPAAAGRQQQQQQGQGGANSGGDMLLRTAAPPPQRAAVRGSSLQGADAAWDNSTLPLWFFSLTSREAVSGSQPAAATTTPLLQLDNVTLVVPEQEWRALAAAVLLAHDPAASAAAAAGAAAGANGATAPGDASAQGPSRRLRRLLRWRHSGATGSQLPLRRWWWRRQAAEGATARVSPLRDLAAEATPLVLDPACGVLVLTAVRHYGWYGTNITLTYNLPPDAPPWAVLLPYPPLVLPFAEPEGSVNLTGRVDFAAATPPPAPGAAGGAPQRPPAGRSSPPAPVEGPPSNSGAGRIGAPPPAPPALSAAAEAQGTQGSLAAGAGDRPAGRGPDPWVAPLAAALSAAGGVVLLAAAASVFVSSWRRQRQSARVGGYAARGKEEAGGSRPTGLGGAPAGGAFPYGWLTAFWSGRTIVPHSSLSGNDSAASGCNAATSDEHAGEAGWGAAAADGGAWRQAEVGTLEPLAAKAHKGASPSAKMTAEPPERNSAAAKANRAAVARAILGAATPCRSPASSAVAGAEGAQSEEGGAAAGASGGGASAQSGRPGGAFRGGGGGTGDAAGTSEVEEEAFLQEFSSYFCGQRQRLQRASGQGDEDGAGGSGGEGGEGPRHESMGRFGGGQPPPPPPPLLDGRPSQGFAALSRGIRKLQAEIKDPELRVLGLLGCGSYGVVYVGTWRGLPVAVKTLVVSDRGSDGGADDGGAADGGDGSRSGDTGSVGRSAAQRQRRRAVLEAAISMSMSHPNVVATYTYNLKPLVAEPSNPSSAFGTEGGSGGDINLGSTSLSSGDADPLYKLHIVQELCNGGNLKDALRAGVTGSVHRGGPFRSLALRLALDVATGMAHVHACRIVHGDLKPENVLLVYGSDVEAAGGVRRRNSGGGSGVQPPAAAAAPPPPPPLVAKVADFGLSQPLAEGATHASRCFQGTAEYVAPEVMSVGRLSPKSDVWSFGVLLLELYFGCTLGDMRRQVEVQGLQPAVGSLGPTLLRAMSAAPDPVCQAYGRLAAACLAPEPRERPDFGAITAELGELAALAGT